MGPAFTGLLLPADKLGEGLSPLSSTLPLQCFISAN